MRMERVTGRWTVGGMGGRMEGGDGCVRGGMGGQVDDKGTGGWTVGCVDRQMGNGKKEKKM